MKYRIGQVVKVKDGVLCPDDPDFDLSGWQGRVIDIDEDDEGPTVGIEWDSITLNEIPKSYIEKSEEEGVSWAEIYLSDSDIEPAKPRDSEKDVDKVREKLESLFSWLHLGDEGKRIQAVVNSGESNDDFEVMKSWGKHLEKTLQFPFEAIVKYRARGPLNEKDRLKVFKIEIVDDSYGVIVGCRKESKRYDFPLVDLDPVNKKKPNAQHIHDYCTWFANR